MKHTYPTCKNCGKEIKKHQDTYVCKNCGAHFCRQCGSRHTSCKTCSSGSSKRG